MIKNFERCDQLLSEWYFRKKNITTTEVVFIQLLSYNIVSKQKKKNENENTECHDKFIPFKSHLNPKHGSLTFLLFGSWSFVRSSHPEVFCEKGVLRSFAKFTGKHLCQSLFFDKVADLRPKACIFIKKRPWHRYFYVNFAKFLRTPFLIEHLWWLLLFSIISSCLSRVKVFPITPTWLSTFVQPDSQR